MSSSRNRNGLSRAIPETVKRKIRQRSGFGCVICGCAIVDYEHVRPSFEEALEHDPSGMTLLCPTHHAEKTRGFQLGVPAILLAMSHPYCHQAGYSHYQFRFQNQLPTIQIGEVRLNCLIPIMVNDEPLLKFEAPEEDGAPFRLSGSFYDSNSKLTLKIVQNEWQAQADNFDVEVSGGRLIIRERGRKVHLKLDCRSPACIVIEELDMNAFGYSFRIEGSFLVVVGPSGKSMRLQVVSIQSIVGFSFGSQPPSRTPIIIPLGRR